MSDLNHLEGRISEEHIADLRAARCVLTAHATNGHSIWRFIGALECIATADPHLAAVMRRTAEQVYTTPLRSHSAS